MRVHDERCKDREGDGDALSGRWRVLLGVGTVESHWEVERSERELWLLGVFDEERESREREGCQRRGGGGGGIERFRG